MRFLKNMKITRSILLVSMIPIIFAIVIASQLILLEVRQSGQLADLAELTELSVKMSNLVHEQQKERGATAVFLGSKGAKFGPQLKAQRVATNKKRDELKKFLTGFDADQFGSVFKTKFNAVLATLGRMDSIRASVDGLSISAPKAIGYYTGLNGQNLELVGYTAKLSPDPQVVSHIVAYSNFLQGKERAGIERAVGANGFASGQFAPKAMEKFNTLINAQNIYNGVFLEYATVEQKQIFQEVMQGAAAQGVQKMREIAASGGLQGNLSGITGKQWFDTITQKINGLKKIEDSLSRDLLHEMGSIHDTTVLTMWITIALTIGILAAVIGLAVMVVRSLGSSFSAMVTSLTGLAEGDLNIALPEATKNEIGEMVHAMKKLRVEVAKSFELGQMVEDMPINVMMCDAKDFTITYMNKSTTTTLKTLEHLLPAKADELVGQCIDIFHKDPSHQRRLLADPSNLPHQANIKLGDEQLSLKVNAIRGKSGDYIGPMLTWSVITEQVELSEKVMNVVNNVSAASTEMRSTAEGMSATAEETSRQTTAVAAAAEQATANVQTVASAAEEMSASVSEINRQVAQSSEIATRANAEAGRTNETVQGLADAASKIGEVVNLISDIAEQTNLLALNATIEAARAGEAGKGFAVVASEVKNLATQTAKATEEISAQVTEMQSVTGDAVGAIKSIADTIGEINAIADTITTAVGEQGSATQEIAENTQQAATGTQEVSTNITGVTQAASETGAAAQEVLSAADELSKQGELLNKEVEAFLVQIKAA